MAHYILSHGQVLDDIYFQCSRQDRLGYDGSTGLHYAFVHNVQSAEAGRDRKPSIHELDHGCFIRAYSLAALQALAVCVCNQCC